MIPEETRVLIVEDELQMRRFLRVTLESHGYHALEAGSAEAGIALAATERPELVLLDLGLPDLDGLEVARRIREWSGVPIIVLSAREQEQDKVRLLDAGADDYLTKPFGAAELLARIRAALRRRALDPGRTVIAAGELRIDLAARKVFLAEREVRLTRIEFRLLAVLARQAGQVVTHAQLLREVWGPNAVDQVQYLRVYMAMLRRKIEADPARPQLLLNDPGVGYRLRTD